VSWWTGDGTAEDVAGGNHGQLHNGVSFAAGMVGQGFLFDGINDYILIPDSPSLDLTNELTVELWFKADDYNGRPLFDKRDNAVANCNYGTILATQYGIEHYYNDATVNDGDYSESGFEISAYQPLPTVGVFHHYAGTYRQADSTHVELKTYVDGALVRTRTILGNLGRTVNNAPLSIGTEGAGAGAVFKGVIDEVSLYNRALSAGEILSIYNAGVSGKCLTNSIPAIVNQPESRRVTVGDTATFSVAAVGSRPLAYQWFFNSSPIQDATNSELVLSNVQYSQAGSYHVVVTNTAGTAVSSNAMLIVLPPPSALKVVSASGPAGGAIELPIQLIAQGFENALGFSLQFDTSFLALQSVSLASGLPNGTSLIVNSNEASAGRLGLAVALPADTVFVQGTGEVVRILFRAAVTLSPVSTSITFGDHPTARQISDRFAQALEVNFINGLVEILRVPFEADVTPRPSGDFAVVIVDWVQCGRFVVGLDQVSSEEFQRVDCAPRETGGNGIISITDWVQAGRYAAAVDPLTPVGGPTGPLSASGFRFVPQAFTPRNLSIPNTNVPPGGEITLPVRLSAQGDENALGFTIVFDPSRLIFVSVTAGASAATATMNANTNQGAAGRVGIALALSGGTTFPAGTRDVVLLTFAASTNAIDASTLSFGDQPVVREISDTSAHALPCGYVSGQVSFGTPREGPALGASRSGGNIILFWPASAQNFELYLSGTVAGVPWTKAPLDPIEIGGLMVVPLPTTNQQQFFRLMKP
jgi:hypothetical protein